MFVEPVLKALEKQSTGLEVEELGAAAPERREVYIVPREDTWSMHEEETWTETETSTASYDKWNKKSQFLLCCTRF